MREIWCDIVLDEREYLTVMSEITFRKACIQIINLLLHGYPVCAGVDFRVKLLEKWFRGHLGQSTLANS